MAETEPEKKAEPEEVKVEDGPEKRSRPWVRPVLVGVSVILVAAVAGFGIGYATRSSNPGPDLSREEALTQSRQQTMKEVSRAMAKRGFIAGKRSGRSHGIIAGGMRAESAVAIEFRQLRAAEAQNQAAEAQSELAGMAGSPPPIPDFSSDDG